MEKYKTTRIALMNYDLIEHPICQKLPSDALLDIFDYFSRKSINFRANQIFDNK